MSYKSSDIVVGTDDHFAIRVKNGFEIYRRGLTHATRVAQIGFPGKEGLERVRKEIARREAPQKKTAGKEARFADYLLDFYGTGGIYTTPRDPFHRPMTREEARKAATVLTAREDFEGDTVDRERARDLVLTWRSKR
jgi:hypothetical protein